MNLVFSKAHTEWLQARVADGTFASVEAAVQQLVEERIALEDITLDDDEMEWVRPLLDEARLDVAEGRSLSLDEHRARNAARLAKIGG
jgi:antitoxin ParD1/3/4